MNETLKTIADRYSCRSYTGEALKKEEVEALALAAVQSPSAMNKQPWKLIVVQDKDLIDEMDAAVMEMLEQEDKAGYERIMGRGGKLFYNAPCLIVIAQKAGSNLDCGIVSENIALAASSMGLGNVICGMARMVFNTAKGAAYKEKLIPQGYEFGMSVLVGYPTNKEGTPHEPDLSKISYIG